MCLADAACDVDAAGPSRRAVRCGVASHVVYARGREQHVRSIRRGDAGAAVAEIRAILVALDLLPTLRRRPTPTRFDADVERAVRAFQQSRGLTVDGEVDDETWRALDAARWTLGARALSTRSADPLSATTSAQLQERLLEMGYDPGRADGIFGRRTARARGPVPARGRPGPDGACGPQTMTALRRLGRKVIGGRPKLLRETERFRAAGPTLVGKRIVIDPGHGGADTRRGRARRTAAVDRGRPRLRPRRPAGGPAGRRGHAGAPDPRAAAGAAAVRAGPGLARQRARRRPAHLAPPRRPRATRRADGVATYHYGTATALTSTVGERLANLVQREIVVRTGMRDCRTHAEDLGPAAADPDARGPGRASAT